MMSSETPERDVVKSTPDRGIKQKISRWLASPRLPYLLFLLSVILCSPALKVGLLQDDYFQRLILLGKPVSGYQLHPLLGLFNFVSQDPEHRRLWMESGILPWWTDPEIRMSFFRPLTAATHILDYRLWPDNFFIQHAHSILWYALGVFVVSLVYRRVFPNAFTAGIAALMFAVEDAHTMPAAWLSNRNSLLALFFCGISLLLHLEWRSGRRSIHLFLALAAFGMGLLSGEAALAITAYLFAYEIFMDRGPLVRRMACLAPYGAMVVVWRVMYKALGYDVIGSGVYLDPVGQPLGFSLAVLERLPVLMLTQWTQLPVDLWMLLPRNYQLAVALTGAAITAVIALLVYPLLKAKPEARFWALGLILSLIPLCSGPPMDRMLIFAGIGAFGLLAGAAEKVFFSGEKTGRLYGWAIGLLLAIHVLFSSILLPARIWALPRLMGFSERIEQAFPRDEGLKSQSVILLNGNEMFIDYISIIRSEKGGVLPKRLSILAPMWSPLTVKRLDENSLLIRPRDGFIPLMVDRFFRDPRTPFKAGQIIAESDFDVEVRKITADHRPAEARFRFKLPLQDHSLRFLYLTSSGFHQFELPAIGQEKTIPGLLEVKEIISIY